MTATDYYSQVASAFHESYQTDPNRKERVDVWRCLLDRYCQPNMSTYDIGCGSGVLTCELAKRVGTVTAMDGANGMLQVASDYANGMGAANISFVRCEIPVTDIRSLPPADLIMASSSLEYVKPFSNSLQYIRPLLKPGAYLLFSVSNSQSYSRMLVRALHRYTGRPAYLDYLQFFTPLEIAHALKQTRLEFVENLYFGGQDKLNRMLAAIFNQPRTSNMILTVARAPS